MAISNNGGAPNQFGGMPFPQMGGGAPQLNLPSVQTGGISAGQLQTTPSQVYSLLSNSPQSLTQLLGPLMQQIYGQQGNIMQPIFQQQGAQGAAQAQSDAMKRGISGSSIESAGIGQAWNQANQGFNQYLAGQLNQIVPQYMQAAGTDVSNQQQYYSNLAQAVGQVLAQQQAQQQFESMMHANGVQANRNNNASMIGGGIGGLGALFGGMATGGTGLFYKP